MTKELIEKFYIEISKDKLKLKEKISKNDSLTWIEHPNDKDKDKFIDKIKKSYRDNIEIIYI